MKKIKTFYQNWELYTCINWAVSAVICFAVGYSLDYPPAPYVIASLLMVFMAVYRLRPAKANIKENASLKTRVEIAAVSELELLTDVEGSPDGFFLGEGFQWGQPHAQKVYNILKNGEDLTLDVDTERGSPWIHGVEPNKKKVRLFKKFAQGNTLIVGATGAGKTRMFEQLIIQARLMEYMSPIAKAVQQALKKGEPPKQRIGNSIIVLDPKGDDEMRAAAQRACELAGHPEKFLYFNPSHPHLSIRLQPLGTFTRYTELATRIMTLVQSSEAGMDSFTGTSWRAVNCIVGATVYCDERPTIMSIKKNIDAGVGGLLVKTFEKFFRTEKGAAEGNAIIYAARAKAKSDDIESLIGAYRIEANKMKMPVEVSSLLSMFDHNREHLVKMIAGLLPVLDMLTASDLGPLLSPDYDDHDDPRPIYTLEDIVEGDYVLYVGSSSLVDKMVGQGILSILLAELASLAGKRYDYLDKSSIRDVYIFADEVGEVVNSSMVQLLNKGRGAGMILFIATQTLADLAVRLGSNEEARQVLGNVNNIIALRTRDGESQKYIVENLPETVVVSHTEMFGTGTSSEQSAASFSGSAGERLSETKDALFPAPLLGKLPDLEFIASIAGGKVYKGKLKRLVMTHMPQTEEQQWLKRKAA